MVESGALDGLFGKVDAGELELTGAVGPSPSDGNAARRVPWVREAHKNF